MLRAQRVQRPRGRRSRSATWLRWLLLLGVAAYTVTWSRHLHLFSVSRDMSPRAPAFDTCAARLGVLGIASTNDATGSKLHLVPAAATAHVTASTAARRLLYDSMSQQLDRNPLQVGEVATQGLQQASLFTYEGDTVKPVLQRLAVPVRAIIMPFLDAPLAVRLAAAVQRHLAPLMAAGGLVWFQDLGMYHSTLWHASHHQNPVPADVAAVDMEAAAVARVAAAACPMRVALERVIALSSGTVLACWQLIEGTEPAALRAQLAAALPNAPKAEAQAIRQPEILYTTLARLLKPPVGDAAAAVRLAAAALTAELCGAETKLHRIWYVQEDELLALALNGEFRKQEMPLECTAAVAA